MVVERRVDTHPKAAEVLGREATEPEHFMWERILALKDAITVLESIGVDLAVLQRGRVLAQRCERKYRGQTGGGAQASLESVQAEVLAAEAQWAKTELDVSPDQFRARFDERLLPFPTVARYARLLSSGPLHPIERRDRFEHVMTRLLWVRDGRTYRIRSRGKAHPVLEFVLPESGPTEGQANAVAFFEHATHRLQGFNGSDELFRGGFYLDIYGYKVALRDELKDPDVLYAAVVLNVHIATRTVEWCQADERRLADIEARFRNQELEVHRVFGETPDAEKESPSGIAALLRGETPKKKRPPVRGWAALRATLKLSHVVMMGITVAAALLLVWQTTGRNVNRLVPIQAQELKRLSPLLEEGAFSRGKSLPIFRGRLTASRWLLLDPLERRKTARAIRSGLRVRNVGAALISSGSTLAIHIDRGHIISVE